MKTSLRILVGVLLLPFLLAVFGEMMVPVIHFGIGWVFAAIRLAEQMKFSWGFAWWTFGILFFVLALRWFVAATWRMRPSLRLMSALTGVFLFVLLAGMSMAGSMHQLAWLATSEEPWFSSRLGMLRARLADASASAAALLTEFRERESWDKEWRALTGHSRSSTGQRLPLHSTYATHLRMRDDDTIHEVILWPRNAEDFKRGGGMIVLRGGERKYVTQPELLAALEIPKEEKRGP